MDEHEIEDLDVDGLWLRECAAELVARLEELLGGGVDSNDGGTGDRR